MKNDFAWVIGGGLLQIPIIQEFKKRGLDVLVSDKNINCAGAEYADAVIQLDTHDVNAHGMYAQELEHRPSAVVADAIDAGPTVSMLAEIYNLPACSYRAAETARNKAKMRQALDSSHPVSLPITTRVYSSFATAVDIWHLKTAMQLCPTYPCIVKPTDNSASRGITKCHTDMELIAAITHARAYNKYSDTVLIEECLSGPERATDWFVENGQVTYVNGAERKFAPDGILELGHLNPAPLPDARMLELAQEAAQRLNIRTGPFKIDFMYDQNYGWCILECATRWSGGFDHTHTQVYATGRDLVKVLADYALTGRIDRQDLAPKWQKYSVAYAPILPEGFDLQPKHVKLLQTRPGIKDVIARAYGPIQKWQNCADRQLFIIAVGDTPEQAWAYATMVASELGDEDA